MYKEWKHVTRLTYILQFPFSVFYFLEAINHIILSNSGNLSPQTVAEPPPGDPGQLPGLGQ
jgi:hypothetical protein